jgi:hypothetical protein
VADWPTISSLATAGGTLVLAVATFASVRSANRAARTAERAFQVALRPVLMPSRLEDPPEKMMWRDGRWATVRGGRAFVEEGDGSLYLAMSLRNVGSGIAVLQAWHPEAGLPTGSDVAYPPLEEFRRQGRDLYVPPGGSSFWQGGLRDEDDVYRSLRDAVASRTTVMIHLLYSDHEGGQRAISLFSLAPGEEGPQWICSVVRHWNLDRPDPR